VDTLPTDLLATFFVEALLVGVSVVNRWATRFKITSVLQREQYTTG